MKAKRIFAMALAIMLAMSSVAYAASTETKEYAVTSSENLTQITLADLGEGELTEAKSVIHIDGKKYKATAVAVKETGHNQAVKREKTYTGLNGKKVKDTLKLKSGETLQLADVKWTEQTRTAATGTMTITGSDSKPDAPATKEITATLPDGRSITVTGNLQRVKQTGSSYSKPFTVKATFTGDEDVDTYMLGDTAIPNNPDSPAFTGYESAILTHLGLEPDQYKITAAKWTSGYVHKDGKIVRYAEYSGQRLTSDWTAYYTETLTADSPQVTTYDAIATYTNGVDADSTEYLITVTYEREGMTLLQKILLASAAIIIFGGLIAAILLIVRKKREKESETVTITEK
ncbi:hypothetical protein [Emergencia sp. 1XD21-10]|uniref:hypothetical protein n=1 Tax=Emergencia sp. 1XD21-10 TaxID=2304569 RepID=UPI00137A7009|nr:hypothetical protein [Emergencia sp. 1XD21-10]NCF00434.1 hypothetical protein [Emergencia sp. 1XD21-10]